MAATTDRPTIQPANSATPPPEGNGGGTTQTHTQPQSAPVFQNAAEFETEPIGFGRAMKWLIFKNFKQQCIRRPMAVACKLLCPMICVALLGLIRYVLV